MNETIKKILKEFKHLEFCGSDFCYCPNEELIDWLRSKLTQAYRQGVENTIETIPNKIAAPYTTATITDYDLRYLKHSLKDKLINK